MILAFQFGNKSSIEKTVKQIQKDVQGDDVSTPKKFYHAPAIPYSDKNKKKQRLHIGIVVKHFWSVIIIPHSLVGHDKKGGAF